MKNPKQYLRNLTRFRENFINVDAKFDGNCEKLRKNVFLRISNFAEILSLERCESVKNLVDVEKLQKPEKMSIWSLS